MVDNPLILGRVTPSAAARSNLKLPSRTKKKRKPFSPDRVAGHQLHGVMKNAVDKPGST